jgi:hypothetical protein
VGFLSFVLLPDPRPKGAGRRLYLVSRRRRNGAERPGSRRCGLRTGALANTFY